MSAIYEQLGAKPSEIPLLWLAAPATGLIVQPIIGYLSDKTWIPSLRMRRRPYFFVGAVLATVALFVMPNSSSLWMAAGMLWVLDASLNISMEPFRAFVADKQNSKQRPTGYALQSLMIGLGTIAGNFIASVNLNELFPSIARWGYSSTQLSFYLCAAIFLCAILYTVITTPEYEPENMHAFRQAKKTTIAGSLSRWWKETSQCYWNMPVVMKRLAWIQFFTWMGLFCMWMYYSVAVARYVFGATDPSSQLYDQGIRFAALTLAVRGIATPLFAVCIPFLVRHLGRANTHMSALIIAGIGLFSIPFIREPSLLYVSMIAAGIGWASVVSMPYVILVEHIPQHQYGIFMGIFNMFIVIPEIMASLVLGAAMKGLFANNHSYAVAFGGILLLLAASLTPSLKRFEAKEEQRKAVAAEPAIEGAT